MATKTTARSRKTVDPRGAAPQPPAAAPNKAGPATADPKLASAVAEQLARRPTAADKRKAAGSELVSVSVPTPFMFLQDDFTHVSYPSGIYDMPRAHAEDSFSQGMGVTLND